MQAVVLQFRHYIGILKGKQVVRQCFHDAQNQRTAKGASRKGPRQKTSKIVKKCQKYFRHFSTFFAQGEKRQNRQEVSRIFSTFSKNDFVTISAWHRFSGTFWRALTKPATQNPGNFQHLEPYGAQCLKNFPDPRSAIRKILRMSSVLSSMVHNIPQESPAIWAPQSLNFRDDNLWTFLHFELRNPQIPRIPSILNSIMSLLQRKCEAMWTGDERGLPEISATWLPGNILGERIWSNAGKIGNRTSVLTG